MLEGLIIGITTTTATAAFIIAWAWRAGRHNAEVDSLQNAADLYKHQRDEAQETSAAAEQIARQLGEVVRGSGPVSVGGDRIGTLVSMSDGLPFEDLMRDAQMKMSEHGGFLDEEEREFLKEDTEEVAWPVEGGEDV